MARSESPAATRLLRAALLLLLLLLAAGRRAAGAPAELRCHCLRTVQGIHLKNVANVSVTPPGPNCSQTEVVAILKNGQTVCLNPAAPMVKKMIDRILKQGSTN